MIVFGRSEAEHDRNFILFLETTRINGLRLNKEKLQFKREEVSFFGHTWNSTGISPDPKKINSILRMKFPEDKETMHSFSRTGELSKQILPGSYSILHTFEKTNSKGCTI